MSDRQPLDFATILPIEEVTAVELKPRLVGQNLHLTPGDRIAERTYRMNCSVRRDIKFPVMVISASED